MILFVALERKVLLIFGTVPSDTCCGLMVLKMARFQKDSQTNGA